MTSPPSGTIGLRLFADPRERLTCVEENGTDAFVMQLPLRHGGVRLECDGGVLFDGPVRPGMMRILAPGERVRVIRRSPAEGAALVVPGELVRRVADEQRFGRGGPGLSLVDPVAEPDPRVERLAWLLGTASGLDPVQRPLFVEGLALALLAVAFGRRRGAGPDGAGHGLTAAQLAACREYADSRLGGGLDLAGWAGAVGLTPSQFTRRFRRATTVSPYAWFLQRRIEAAKLLLVRPGASLAWVALEVGFSSQSHFTEAFRRQVGVPPDRWRRQVDVVIPTRAPDPESQDAAAALPGKTR